MTKTKMYRLADALRVKAELDAMPQHQPEEISLREALTLLSPEIHALRRKNYGWTAIVTTLAKAGIEVSPSVLRKRLSEHRDGSQTKGSRRNATKDGAPARRPATTTAARGVAMPKPSPAAKEDDARTEGPGTEGAPSAGAPTTFLQAAARGERPPADAATIAPAEPPPPPATRTTGESVATTTAGSRGSDVTRTTRQPIAESGQERAEDVAGEAPGAGVGMVRPQPVISVATTAAPKGHAGSGTARPKAGS